MAGAIYLDVDDEITSAVTRIRSAEPGPVVMVVPFGSRLASSRINFRLLAREAAALQRGLVIVAPDPATRALAASAGLATHATVLEYESAGGDGMRRAGQAPVVVPAAAREPARSGEVIVPGEDDASAEAAGRATSSAPLVPPVVVVSPASPATLPASRPLPGPRPAPPIPFVGPIPRGAITQTRVIVALVVVALLAAVVGVAALAFLPTAEIVVTPVSEAVGPLGLTVTADPSVTAPDAVRLVVPATRLTIPVSVSATFPATGKLVTDAKASGAVTFTSIDTGRAHTIASGTVVRTSDGVEFATTAPVSLPRAKFNPPTAATATVGIIAVKAGVDGNVGAGTIRVWPSNPDPVTLSVTNPSATSGGLHTETPEVQKSDVDAALVTLRSRLNDAFAAKLADPATTPAGSLLVSQTQKLGDASPTVDPATVVNLQQASFELGLSASGTAIAVDPTSVTSVADAKLAASVGAGYQLVTGSTKATVDPPTASGDVVAFAVRVRGDRSRELDQAVLLAQVLGKSIAAARSILEPYGDVRITVWPDWVTSIPGADSRVKLTIATLPPGGSPAPSGTSPGGSVSGDSPPARTGSTAPAPTTPAPTASKR